jgi:uncharacterized membrane protein
VIEERVMRVIEIVGALSGTVSLMGGIVFWFVRRTQDPFLKYWFISAAVGTVSVWLVLRFTSARVQIWSLSMVFVTIAALVTSALLWRFVDVYWFCKSNGKFHMPAGFKHRPNYWPYAVLMGACIIAIVTMVFCYTSACDNSANRLPALLLFGGLLLFITVSRLIWLVLDKKVEAVLATGKTEAR